MAQGSGGYGGPNYSAIEGSLRNIAVQFTSILEVQQQLRASLDTWSNLQRELTLANAAAGGTAQNFQQMQSAAESMALATNFSAGQVAQSFYDLASAGLTVTQVLQASTGVILLAQATLTDLGSASDTVASALAQFNLQATDSYRIANLFVAASNSSLATMPKLAFALRQVGPVAADAGLSIEQTVASLDKLFDAGLRGEQAGTALRNIISRITDPRGVGKDLLLSIGIQFTDPKTGDVRNFQDIAKDLANKTNLSLADATQIAGPGNGAAFITYLNSLKSGVAGATSELEQHEAALTGTNAAYRESLAQMQTLDGATHELSNSFNEFRIVLGESLAPIVVSLADHMHSLALEFQGMDAYQRANTLSWAAWAVSLGLSIGALATIGKSIGSVVKLIPVMTEAVGALRIATGATGAITMTEFFTAGATGAAGMATSIAGLAVAAAGIVGVIALVGGLAYALVKAHEATQNASFNEGVSNVLNRRAQAENLNPQETSRLTTQSDYVPAAQAQAENIPKLAPVDPNTGSGAAQQYAMITDFVTARNSEITDLAHQFNELKNNYATLKPTYQASINGLHDVLVSAPTNAYSAIGYSGGDTTQIFASLSQFANTQSGQIKQGIATYQKSLDGIADNLKIPDADKDRVKGLISTYTDQLLNTDATTLVTFRDIIKSKLPSVQNELNKDTNSVEVANTLDKLMSNAVDELNRQLILDPTKLKALMGNKKVQAGQLQQLLLTYGDQQAGLIPAMVQETAGNVIGASTVSDKDKAALMEFTKAQLGQSGSGLMAPVLQYLTTHGGDEAGAAKVYVEQVKKWKSSLGDALKPALDVAGNYAIIDPSAAQTGLAKSKVEMDKARLTLLEGINGADMGPVIEELRIDLQNDNTATQVDGLKADLTKKGQNAALISAVMSLPSDMNSQLAQLISSATSDTSDAGRKKLEDAIVKFFAGKNNGKIVDTPEVRAVIETAINKQIAGQASVTTQIKNAQLAATKSDVQLTPAQDIAKALLQLPSDQELYNQQQTLVTNTKYQLASYFNMPLAAVDQAFETTQLDYSAKFIAAQKKYIGYYQTLAKGVGDALTDPALQDAFSGKTLQTALEGNGQATFDGNAYAVKTTQGLTDFLSAIKSKFATVAANSPDATGQINKANTYLDAMAQETEALFQNFGGAMDIITLRKNDAMAKVNSFLNTFNAQQMIDQFKQALEVASGGSGADAVGLNIDVAINARTAQVKIDAQNAIDKLKASYQSAFSDLNVPVMFDAKTNVASILPANDNVIPNTVGLPGQAPLSGSDGTRMAQLQTAVNQIVTGKIAPQPVVVSGSISAGFGGATSVAKQIYDFFISKPGITPAIAAAFVGNVGQESSFNPNVEGPTIQHGANAGQKGFGLFQDVGSRRVGEANYAADNNLDTGAIAAELGYTWQELTTGKYKDVLASLIASHANDTAGATELIGTQFEKAGSGEMNMQKRQAYAAKAATQFGGIDPGSAIAQPASDPARAIQQAPPVAPTAEQLAEAQRDRDVYNQLVAQINAAAAATTAFMQTPAFRMSVGVNDIAVGATANYDKGQGAVYDAGTAMAQRQGQAATIQGNTAGLGLQMGGSLKESLAQIQSAATSGVIAKATEDWNTQLKAVGDTYTGLKSQLLTQIVTAKAAGNDTTTLQNQYNTLVAEQASAEQAINDIYAKRIALAPSSLEAQRASYKSAADALTQAANDNGGNTSADAFTGLKASALDAAQTTQSVFETARSAGKDAIDGLTEAGVDLFEGMAGSAKKAIASMLLSISKLIAQMLIMKAIGAATGLFTGGLGSGVTQAGGLGGIYAQGGVHGPGGPMFFASGGTMFDNIGKMVGFPGASSFTKQMLMAGGTRAAGNPATAVFGEGQHPEAFIPMVDRQTVPVHFDLQGNPKIPLPSGQSIPVSLHGMDQVMAMNRQASHEVRAFAQGGLWGGDNVIPNKTTPYSRSSAMRADKLTAANDAVSSGASARSGGANSGATVNHNSSTIHAPITIQLSGGATKEDADMVGKAAADHVMSLIQANDAENARQRARRNGGTMAQFGFNQ